VFACPDVCLSTTPEPLENRDITVTKYSGHHPPVELANNFENGCCEVRGW